MTTNESLTPPQPTHKRVRMTHDENDDIELVVNEWNNALELLTKDRNILEQTYALTIDVFRT